MRINTAKEKMMEGKAAFGFSLGLGSPLAAELLANSGIDFILLDRQHGSWGEDSTIAAFAAMSAGSAVPMARVSRNDYTMIGRLLDEGAMGIVVPMVHTPEDAKRAADACRLPPVGDRSWGWGRARNLGDDYSDEIDEQIFVAVQIESALAVENVEAIMATPGVDGCWVGPSDLSLSFGFHPSEMDVRDEHVAALETVIQACKNTGTVPGIAALSVDDGVRRYEQGFRYITAGGDAPFLLSGAAAALIKLRGAEE